MTKLSPIYINEDKDDPRYDNEFCRDIFKSYPDYYHKTGYHPPFIGYFVIRDEKIVGVAGFTGKPTDGKVEIAYGTNKLFEGQGIASFACHSLVAIARAFDPFLVITAKTAPEKNASTSVLEKNGFTFTRNVQDEGIGDAWEWVYQEGAED
jgi:RimJ/RimL family protein N-acetyltransferase